MPIITIPKELTKKNLILISRDEYEGLLRARLWNVKEVEMTSAQKRALSRARRNLSRGKFLTVYELRKKLER